MSSSLNFNEPSTWYDTASDSDKDLFKTWVRDALKGGEVNVTFFKADGTIRDMRCTLEEASLPKIEVKEGTSTRKRSEDALAVFDLDKNEWRSFRFDKIKEVRYTLGN